MGWMPPGAEAGGENIDQCGSGGGLDAGNTVKGSADEAHEAHIQKGGSIASDGEVVGGSFGRAAQNSGIAGKHIGAVGHEESGHQEAQAEEKKENLQKCVFGKVVQSFHGRSSR